MPELKLAFALHDVTPFHRERIDRAEALFARWGVAKATYLFIPDYHGEHPAATREFTAWCRRERSFAVDWFLHGYYHRECRSPHEADEVPTPSSLEPAAGEAEFAAIDDAIAAVRLDRGTRMFEQCLGHVPRGFVAPRWAFKPSLSPLLQKRGFEWTESYGDVVHVPTGRRVPSPAITWATRTVVRKWTSLAGVPWLRVAWGRAPALRIAVHPFDFDHPQTVCSIERTVRWAIRRRRQILYSELA
jgi:predicted deacetylase